MTGVMKKISIASIAFLILAMPQLALAQAVITEIMYDPPGTDSGHEWIEVYNTGATPIALTTWKLYEGGAKHNIISSSGGKSLAPGSYAVIAESAAKFQSDYPDFSGQLFHSAFSLDNAGATLELYDASSSVVESVSYDSSAGASGDGNSLERPPDESDEFSPHVPTPGRSMTTNVVPAKVKAAWPVKAPREKSSKESSSKTSASDKPGTTYTDGTDQTDEAAIPSSEVAAAAAPRTTSDSYWWLALGALAVVAGGAMAASKHFKKTEWDIVEETPEDV
jgi:lamin tail-like protein